MSLQRVVIFYSSLTTPGGAERQAVEEYRYFESRGIETFLLTFTGEQAAFFGYDLPGLEVVDARGLLDQIWQLRRRLRAIQPDIVIASSGVNSLYFATAFLEVPYAFHHNSPVSYEHEAPIPTIYSWLHRTAFKEIQGANPGNRSFIEPVKRFTLLTRIRLELKALLQLLAIRKARCIFVLSHQTKSEIRKFYKKEALIVRGCLPPEIFVYQPRSDIKKELRIENKRMILSISRLDYKKRVDLLIEAFALMREKPLDSVLVIGGLGPEEPRLRNMLKVLRLQQEVRFVGFVPEDRLWDYYAACDIFVTPAWADFDIAPYEALALKRKVVWSTEMETEPWVLESGLVFECGPTATEFAKSMTQALATDAEQSIDLRAYSWDAMFKKVHRHCERSLSAQ